MNGKKAKMLRKAARQMTAGMQNVKYTDVALNPHKPTRRSRQLYDCTRRVYKELKRRWKAA
jgi:hypothetical protein